MLFFVRGAKGNEHASFAIRRAELRIFGHIEKSLTFAARLNSRHFDLDPLRQQAATLRICTDGTPTYANIEQRNLHHLFCYLGSGPINFLAGCWFA
jgi:hypothetical protein